MDKDVPYIVHEGAMARMERTVKRLIIAVIVMAVVALVSNGLWLWAWCQYDYESSETTVTQDSEGHNIYGNGKEINGTEDSSKEKETKEEK
jgi:hypothetical protein